MEILNHRENQFTLYYIKEHASEKEGHFGEVLQSKNLLHEKDGH